MSGDGTKKSFRGTTKGEARRNISRLLKSGRETGEKRLRGKSKKKKACCALDSLKGKTREKMEKRSTTIVVAGLTGDLPKKEHVNRKFA